ASRPNAGEELAMCWKRQYLPCPPAGRRGGVLSAPLSGLPERLWFVAPFLLGDSPMRAQFWKLSQGGDSFAAQDTLLSIEQRLVYVHGLTPPLGGKTKSQGDEFIDAPLGDYFYLTHANKGIYILGQFSGPPNIISARGDGWVDRPFRFIRAATTVKPYAGPDKWWAPNHNSTFVAVPDDELKLFEDSILWPHFGIRLSDFRIEID